ncbi:hypothetical protein AVEN_246231-1 [Araneus ventricosus]|uniref:Uncharacterized protein n=1 Tax=Araneus ventricosus TaxID=182803 RepID=A0A4Y2K8F2_ARAVE|nr:hypothetical protein AVEN_246231-1 [Araneus ventricosus]
MVGFSIGWGSVSYWVDVDTIIFLMAAAYDTPTFGVRSITILRTSAKDKFCFTLSVWISFSSFQQGHVLKYEGWSPLQLIQRGVELHVLPSWSGEVDGRISPSGAKFREPILRKSCSSRYAPAHHGAQQGKAVTGSGIFQPQHLPKRWHRDIDLQKTAGLTLKQYFPVPKGKYHQPIDKSGLTPAARLTEQRGPRGKQRNPRIPFCP